MVFVRPILMLLLSNWLVMIFAGILHWIMESSNIEKTLQCCGAFFASFAESLPWRRGRI